MVKAFSSVFCRLRVLVCQAAKAKYNGLTLGARMPAACLPCQQLYIRFKGGMWQGVAYLILRLNFYTHGALFMRGMQRHGFDDIDVMIVDEVEGSNVIGVMCLCNASSACLGALTAVYDASWLV
jgi:hypothetical protein